MYGQRIIKIVDFPEQHSKVFYLEDNTMQIMSYEQLAQLHTFPA